MASCKDCINYDVCSISSVNCDRANHCTMHKDRSKFVELPCKIGDMVYFPSDDRHNKAQIIHISIVKDNIYFVYVQHDWHYETPEIWDEDEFKLSDIGKTVFLTREEAEKALEEREQE